MNLDKLGLVFFINYFNQIDSVKRHLLASFREFLLALASSFEIVSRTAEQNTIFNRFDLIAGSLKKVEDLLKFSVLQLSPLQGSGQLKDTEQLKAHVVESIIAVIDEEIEAVGRTTNVRNQMKAEALYTVKQVLISHLQRGSLEDFDALLEDEGQVANLK